MCLATGIRNATSRPRSGVLAALLLATADPAAAQEAGTDLRRFLYDDATATLHLRSYYLDRTNPSPPHNVAWAGGGWIGYETGGSTTSALGHGPLPSGAESGRRRTPPMPIP